MSDNHRSHTILPSEIKNKHKREEVRLKQRKAKAKANLKRRIERKKEEQENPELREARLRENIPATQENTREFDEAIVQEADEEVVQEEEADEFAQYFNGQAPKVLITTTPNAGKKTVSFVKELVSVIPNLEYVKRSKAFALQKIIEFCRNREYTDLIVISEDHKEPTHLTLVHLPEGPTAHFRLTRVKGGRDISGHGRSTSHYPELILNRFSTRLGHTIGRMFAALFPQVPEFQGRQAVTFHNQRDYIFFRRHRYVFRSGEKVDLQEIGPRFTLKLRWLQKGLYDPTSGEYEWIYKADLETSRRRVFL
ncbi:Ribosome production factor 1 [Coemansia sp. RSA 1722]|nr:Ribosome production factor 1 [Coemansia sp. RSA 485]KAJ2601922.1 Ribosome production factor 1 [Coemansia sp. RSA 1721]KAJ2603225.1 Ribosome production factor 1 [Coemansia sp. RSA 1722]KAJ2635534.1 Ribosome production factor 1 [Coemansia sp. RSA 1286]KAJ2707528.1 Ribosome production factor 1 [Coemansia sp. IMI 203386]